MPNAEKVVTRELVFEVANRLVQQGVTPTNRKILHETGGSMSSVAAFFREWKAEHEAKAAASAAEVVDLPPPVADALRQAGTSIWQVALAEIRREVNAAKELAAQRAEAAEEERDQVIRELEEAEQELVALKMKADEEQSRFATELADLRRSYLAIAEQNQVLQQRLGTETARAAELEKQVEADRTERTALRELAEAERARMNERLSAAQGTISRLQARDGELEKQIKEMKADRDQLATELTSARQEAKDARESAAELSGQVAALTRALDSIKPADSAGAKAGKR